MFRLVSGVCAAPEKISRVVSLRISTLVVIFYLLLCNRQFDLMLGQPQPVASSIKGKEQKPFY